MLKLIIALFVTGLINITIGTMIVTITPVVYLYFVLSTIWDFFAKGVK